MPLGGPSLRPVVASDRLLAFAATAFALIVVPGPSVLFVISRGVVLGRRAALATVVGVANPKVAVFFAAVLPQFADPSLGRVPLQLLVLGLVFVAIALVSDGAWGVAAGTARA